MPTIVQQAFNGKNRSGHRMSQIMYSKKYNVYLIACKKSASESLNSYFINNLKAKPYNYLEINIPKNADGISFFREPYSRLKSIFNHQLFHKRVKDFNNFYNRMMKEGYFELHCVQQSDYLNIIGLDLNIGTLDQYSKLKFGDGLYINNLQHKKKSKNKQKIDQDKMHKLLDKYYSEDIYLYSKIKKEGMIHYNKEAGYIT